MTDAGQSFGVLQLLTGLLGGVLLLGLTVGFVFLALLGICEFLEGPAAEGNRWALAVRRWLGYRDWTGS